MRHQASANTCQDLQSCSSTLHLYRGRTPKIQSFAATGERQGSHPVLAQLQRSQARLLRQREHILHRQSPARADRSSNCSSYTPPRVIPAKETREAKDPASYTSSLSQMGRKRKTQPSCCRPYGWKNQKAPKISNKNPCPTSDDPQRLKDKKTFRRIPCSFKQRTAE